MPHRGGIAGEPCKRRSLFLCEGRAAYVGKSAANPNRIRIEAQGQAKLEKEKCK
jgi:hypothetical protein